ncbi:hypothetical protein FEK66_24755 [Escherichia sp. E1130]|uniref:SpvB/TcaC N-terminal domain-containing protein n=1 Tax=Escherichia sp. E1130 TaxID=2041645 RepID=UPI0010FF4CB3|nr:SpvB/TcaC N-terminal domain-containing protein [Escherichia sp. E1130]TLI62496.1 hypothetical protein FEK66_24755 [Escherichia sp. E1130]
MADVSQNGARESSFFTPPSLPKGGGTLTGSGGALQAGGPDGVAGWSIPLPVSAGRGFAPELALNYSSAGGNSEFGLGWQLPVPVIRRDTRKGVPKYDDDDIILAPDGTDLLRHGEMRQERFLPFSASGKNWYNVIPYISRFGGISTRYECWTELVEGAIPFWIQFLSDGGLALYGWTAEARLSDGDNRVAEWRLDEQMTARGEHIVWAWRNDSHGNLASEERSRPGVNRYLSGVYWGNKEPALHFLRPVSGDPTMQDSAIWFCCLRFDYGERTTPVDLVPPYYAPPDNWSGRPDAFTHYRYGFSVRTRRLCRDILLYHRTGLMAGGTDTKETLVSRLHLTHEISPSVSWLSAAQVMAYDPDANNAPVTTPPVEFNLSQPSPLPASASAWQYRDDLDGFSYQYWQMADLMGEGLTGLLYQDSGGWWYRAPVRDTREGAGPDALTWATPRKLERIPSLAGWRLMDLNGDGRPESVVSLPGVTGSFTLNADAQWQGFVPFGAIPAEFLHSQMQIADLTGAGLSDLVMVGPRSVRLWPSDGNTGWKRVVSEHYGGSRPLPIGNSENSLVLFSDIPGSGQQHLTEITPDCVRYWPSLGHGKFGEVVELKGFSVPQKVFCAGNIYLADTDGSGTPDILYLEHDGIRVFMNESGNRFTEAGVIPLPEGIHGDDLCTLQVSDIQGLGVASLLLTAPHSLKGLKPRSWLLNLNTVKPWLLIETSDNGGGRTLLEYRSSAQGWLDEKAGRQRDGERTPVSYLPFPVHTVSRITQVNDITGLVLGSETRYLGGVWDGEEREFAGFTRLIQCDTHERTAGTAAEISPPAEIRSWFMTGLREHDAVLSSTYGGLSELPHKPVRFTRWNEGEGREEAFSPGTEGEVWLRRALRGVPVRTETYGLDGSDRERIPYSVTVQRWQVRAYSTENADKPAALASPLESLSYSCERISQDPVISQSLLLTQDKYGNTLESVTLNYPRRLSPGQLEAEETARAIYPASLPEGIIRESTDTQQYDCWLNLTRATVHNLDDGQVFVTGLPEQTRTDVIWYGTTHPDGNPEGRANHDMPGEGFSVEFLLQETGVEGTPVRKIDSLLATAGSVAMTGYSKTHWRSAVDGVTLQDQPDRQALVAFTETAMHDKQSLDVLRPVFDQTLRDLVFDVLNDTTGQKDPAVLTRVRDRLPEPVPGALLYQAFFAATENRQRDSDVIDVLKKITTGRIDRRVLMTYVLEAPASLIPEEKKKAIDPNGGVPAEWLWYAVREYITDDISWEWLWYGARQYTGDGGADESDGGMPSEWLWYEVIRWLAVVDALNERTVRKGKATESLLPDTLFWQAVTGSENNIPGMREFLSQRVQEETLEQLLERGGYHPVNVPFSPAVSDVRSGWHNHTEYHSADAFWLPKAVRESDRVKATDLTYTDHWLTVKQATDEVSHFTAVDAFDWRFLSPVKVKDINDNIAEAKLDALGRTVWHRFYGTETPVVTDEAGYRRLSDTPVKVGYAPLKDIQFTPPATVEAALALNANKGVPVHEAFTPVTDSWMPLSFDVEGNLTGERCGELAWRRRVQQLAGDHIMQPDIMNTRTPPHIIRIQTDRYDSDPEQQVRVQVTLHGGGQVLQTAALSPAGEAFVRTEAGGLEAGSDGKAVTAQADVRWAVTGKTEFDNKGQAIRVWLPFYLNDWRWVSDDSARDGIYADTHVYDAAGREVKVVRAAGEDVDGVWANYLRRSQANPWFTVQEDENDTWAEVIENAKRKKSLH